MPLDRRLRWAAVLIVAFAALSLAVLVGSPLASLDDWVRALSIHHHPGPRAGVIFYLVELGQRGPTNKAALILFVLLSLRRRNVDALAVFVASFFMNNLFVGFIKVGIGRWGPRVTSDAHSVLRGGDIFPSGHVTNAVVLFGVLALTATRFRRTLAAVAVAVALIVGFGTLWLDTHWVTDVIGGWLAGAIVLLLVPRFDGLTDRVVAWARRRLHRPDAAAVPQGVPAARDHHAHVG